MSFSNTVKKEIISAVTDKDKKFACLYGMLIFCKKFTEKEIVFQSESQIVADTFTKLVAEVFKGTVKVEKDIFERKNNSVLYCFSIKESESIRKVSDVFKIDIDNREIDLKNIDNNNLSNFIAGVFLSCGSVTNPNNEYHLEYVIPSEQLYNDLSAILGSLGLENKFVMRKNSYILYFKESENIEDILTFMGAQGSTLELINVKILKDMRNRANRVSNCDIANCNKTIEAAVKQKQDIELIDREIGIDTLPATLKEIAFARLNNPELSLKELGEILDPPIGRSGVNHRLQRLGKMADEIRGKLNGK